MTKTTFFIYLISGIYFKDGIVLGMPHPNTVSEEHGDHSVHGNLFKDSFTTTISTVEGTVSQNNRIEELELDNPKENEERRHGKEIEEMENVKSRETQEAQIDQPRENLSGRNETQLNAEGTTNQKRNRKYQVRKQYFENGNESRQRLSLSEIWRQRKGKSINHTLIDKAFTSSINPDSELTDYLMSEVVESDGVEIRTIDSMKDIISNKSKVYGDKHDRHKYTEEQELMLKRGSKMGENNTKSRRNVAYNPLWQDGIVHYKIHSTLYNYKDTIYEAIAVVEDRTCVQFKQDQKRKSKDYVEFKDSYYINPLEQGCWSYIGAVYPYLNGGTQYIGLQTPVCISVNIIVHELLHVLGLVHEQNRSDRDDFVTMKWNNIQAGTDNLNMAKIHTINNHEYDYSSLLQYSLNAYAEDKSKPTMVLKDPRLDFLVDAGGMSYYDAQDIIDAYECTSSCPTPLPECKHAGYVDHNCKCVCPSHLTGSLCDEVKNSELEDCGGIFDISDGVPKTIQSSTEYPGYKVGRICTWLIVAAKDKKVRLKFLELDLPTNGKVCYHTLETQFNLQGQVGLRYCGKLSKPQYIDSTLNREANILMLTLDTRVSDVTPGKGFSILASPADLYSTKYECTFETDSCFMADDTNDKFDWTRREKSTPSKDTGPSGASQGSFYSYIETSSPRKAGDNARLMSKISLQEGPWCLTFDYHMYGIRINSLKILAVGSSTEKVLWEMNGNQGNKWNFEKLQIDVDAESRVAVEATRGYGYTGDIAIDNIVLINDPCQYM